MSLAEVFAPAEAVYRAQVMADTWGHLAPKPQHKYQGTVLFSRSEYGNELGLIRVTFPDLDDSPWFFQALNEHFFQLAKDKLQSGEVAEWSGTYMAFKNGNYRFSGTVRKINCQPKRIKKSGGRSKQRYTPRSK